METHIQCIKPRMASEPERWLKRQYEEDPVTSSGSLTKRVKFSEMHERICAQFPAAIFSPQSTSALITKTFPNTDRKRMGGARGTYVTGIREIEGNQSEIKQLRAQVMQLQQRVEE